MKKIFFCIGTLCSIAFISSCNEEHTEEKNSAVITITGPIQDDHIHHNDTLHITGSIVSEMDMHGYNVSIRRLDSQAEIFYLDDHYHGSNKNLSIDWPCNVNAAVELRLTITAKLDHDGNAAIKYVDFNCEP